MYKRYFVIFLVIIIAGLYIYSITPTDNKIIVTTDGWTGEDGTLHHSEHPISDAHGKIKSGGEIIVKDGVYHESLELGKNITLRSENGPENCIIKQNTSTSIIEVGGDGVKIRGFTITGSSVVSQGTQQIGPYEQPTSYESTAIKLETAEGCEISNNIIDGAINGVDITENSTQNLITNNTFKNVNFPIYLEEGVYNNTISYNIFLNLTSKAFRVYSYDLLDKNYIFNNTKNY